MDLRVRIDSQHGYWRRTQLANDERHAGTDLVSLFAGQMTRNLRLRILGGTSLPPEVPERQLVHREYARSSHKLP